MRHAAAEQLTVSPHDEVPMHFTSQAHDDPHDTALHDWMPVHSTSHLLVPHWTF